MQTEEDEQIGDIHWRGASSLGCKRPAKNIPYSGINRNKESVANVTKGVLVTWVEFVIDMALRVSLTRWDCMKLRLLIGEQNKILPWYSMSLLSRLESRLLFPRRKRIR